MAKKVKAPKGTTESEMRALLDDLDKFCVKNKIPYFAEFVVYGENDGEAMRLHSGHSAQGMGVALQDDTIPKHMMIMQGCDAVPFIDIMQEADFL